MFVRLRVHGKIGVNSLAAVTNTPPPALPPPPAVERVRVAMFQRTDSDYYFSFWTAFGWTILTCGIYGFYVAYQLVRRSRDHNARRTEMLDAAALFAWQQAEARGVGDELRPNFNRISAELNVLRQQAAQFRDPVVWTILSIIGYGIVIIILYILIDSDLVTHDRAEWAIEHELSIIYARLGAAVPAPNNARLKSKHNYVGRIVATIFTFGIYRFVWEYNVMTQTNAHYQQNWAWEDALAVSVQQLDAA
jgi:hypothetical protein